MKEDKNRIKRKRRKVPKNMRINNRTEERKVKSKRKTRVRRVKRSQGRNPA